MAGAGLRIIEQPAQLYSYILLKLCRLLPPVEESFLTTKLLGVNASGRANKLKRLRLPLATEPQAIE